MKSASDFLNQLQNDPVFIKSAKACNNDEDRKHFLLKGGFAFSAEELDAAVKCLSFFEKSKKVEKNGNMRKNNRYDVFLGISEIDGRPVNKAIIVDISSWGAKIESEIPLKPDSSVEFCISLLNGPGQKKDYRLTGKVLWASQVPISRRNNAGLQFNDSLDHLHENGKFPLDHLQSTINGHHKDIADKEFLSIKEFADMVGVHWFTVWRWTVERRIQFKQVKSGCKIMIPRSELAMFQTAQGQ